MLPEDWRQVGRVVVMQLGSRQDLLLTIPALQRLRQLLNAAITLVVSPDGSQIDLPMPWIDEVLVYDGASAMFVNAECELALISKLRGCAFDAAFIFTNVESPYSLAYICYLAGIPIRIGQSLEFGGGVLSHCVKPAAQNPADKHLFLIESALSTEICHHYASSPGTSTAAISTT